MSSSPCVVSSCLVTTSSLLPLCKELRIYPSSRDETAACNTVPIVDMALDGNCTNLQILCIGPHVAFLGSACILPKTSTEDIWSFLLLLYYSSLLIGELQGLTILSHRYDSIDPFLYGLLYLGPLCSTRGTTALVLATIRPVAWSRCAGARHLATWTMRTTAAAAGPLAAWWRRVYLPTHVSGVGLGIFVVPLSSSFWPS
jgi:hypothetical protein